MHMSDTFKNGVKFIATVAQAVILLVVSLVITMLFNTVISHGNVLAAHGAMIANDSSRLERIEIHGSSGLEAHAKEDDQRVKDITGRVEKLEAAVLALQAAPGELKAMNVRLDGMSKSIDKIEKLFEEHLKDRKP